MVLIISREDDKSADDVISWLNYFDYPFFRINQGDRIWIDSFAIDPTPDFQMRNIDTSISIKFSQLKSCYYRVGCIDFDYFTEIAGDLMGFFHSERSSLSNFLYTLIEMKLPFIGSYYSEVRNNKLTDLALAQKIGLHIPRTIITNLKKDTWNFYNSCSSIISKPISNNVSFGKYYKFAIKPLSVSDIENLSEQFQPTLFQEYIPKKIDIRVFFVADQYFSMAIYSQGNSKTQFDFRNYDKLTPNRVEPIKLNKKTIEKLSEFSQKSKLTTGSFDLLLTEDGQITFLEVNPSGQFEWLSKRCNYHIEKIIAEKIISNEENRKT